MRALVTGADGFVGRYLATELRARGIETVAAGREPGPDVDVAFELGATDAVRRLVADARADVVYHLAAQAFVPEATRAPLETYDTNALGTARVVEAIRALGPEARPRLVYVSSGEVYGEQPDAAFPLRETTLAKPVTAYAASKLAAEAIVLASARAFGLHALVTRAFNHIGPGQSDRFVVASFARRLAAIAAGGPPLFPVGNLTAQRDFLDVRDVVRAYADLGERGATGEIYNVCSGKATRIVDVLRTLVTIARVGVEIREDPALVRPVDVPLFFGDAAKLREATGWEPRIALPRSLREIYDAERAAFVS